MQNCLYFPWSPFSYICCIINRHEKQAENSVPFPCWFCTIFFLRTANMFHRIYNWKLKTKAWHKLKSLLPALCSPHKLHTRMSRVRCSKPQKQKYIYSIHSLDIYTLRLQRIWAEKWRRFHKKQSFKKVGDIFST